MLAQMRLKRNSAQLRKQEMCIIKFFVVEKKIIIIENKKTYIYVNETKVSTDV